MKITDILIAIIVVFLVEGCETDPIISIPSKPIPVIYAVLDDLDSTHRIFVTKSFGAKYNPSVEASNYDSLFFNNIIVEVDYLPSGRHEEWQTSEVYKIIGQEKDSGFFSYPIHEYYQFNLVLRDYPITFVDSIQITLRIPGYQDVTSRIKLTEYLKINTPKPPQQYIYLVPSSTLKIQWSNVLGQKQHAWSEIDVAFEFIEELSTGFRSKWVKIQNTQYFLSPHSLYRELNITYNEFIREVLLQIPDDDQVLKRFLGYISIHLSGGDENMMQYKKFLHGYSDYSYGGFSNIQNGYGLFSSATRFKKDSMRFDYETRQTLINENRLRKLRISKWTE